MRVLIEVLHIIAGLACAVILASLAAWSYPLARSDIWLVAFAGMVAVVAMGVGPLLRAYRADRETLARTRNDG